MLDSRHREFWAVPFLFSIALTASNSKVIATYFDGLTAQAVAALTMFVSYLIISVVARKVFNEIPVGAVRAAIILILIALIVCFLVVYPIEGAPQGVTGSDQDDAVNILADHLFSLSSPYGQLTYLDNPISNMAGSAILGWPARELMGSSAWGNPFIVVAATAAMWRFWGPRPAAFTLLMSSASLGFLSSYLVGGDYFTSAIVLVSAAFWFRASRPGSWHEYAAAILVAVSGTTRIHLPAVILILAAIIIIRKGSKSAPAVAVMLFVSGALVLIWFLPDPDGFAPLDTTGHAGGFIPTLVLIAFCGLLLILAFRRAIDIVHLWLIGAAIIAVEVPIHPEIVFRGTPLLWFAIPTLISQLGIKTRGL